MGTVNAVELQANAAKVHNYQSTTDHNEAFLAQAFHQELNDAKAAQALANNKVAELEFSGGKSDVAWLNGHPISDPNYTRVHGFIFFKAPPTIVGPKTMSPITRPPVPLTGPTGSGETTPKDGAPQAQPAQPSQAKPDTIPPTKTEEKTECEKADGAHGTGSTVPPTPADIDRLVAEHSQDKASPPLTHAAANSIVAQTQPPGTKAKIAGQGVEGPDIVYSDICTKMEVDTVQVKSIMGFRGFDKELSDELDLDNPKPSRIIAFQVPENTNVSKWMGRYWGNRIKDNPSGWHVKAAMHAHMEVLIVDPYGKMLERQPVFDPTKVK